MGVRKRTELKRITCIQELRLLLDAEHGAPAGSERRVQLLLPEGPEFFFSLDLKPEDVALGRTWKLPFVPGGQVVEFNLQPDQRIYGCVDSGIGQASMLVEYVEQEG